MNRLGHETSPYLLQHAHNPVDWFPWGEEALQKAKYENKPILVSIGYSACHWCHVMEHESFEKENVAAVMNAHFVCIKVDREERPDVDAVYMDAVQAMGVRGGWPLNVFLLPDARPFYGVTYLPAQNWVQLLKSVDNAFQNHYQQLAESAEGFVQNMLISEPEKYGLAATGNSYPIEELDRMFETLQKNFDEEKGGMDRAPKFPMPSIYKFILRYFDLTQHPEALRHLERSLTRIAMGGIYDHVGGGWARYSVDDEWFIPHFEKMLYDNAQLISIFSEAYALTQNPLFADRVRHTIEWLITEMRSPEGGFYSALDADSEGVEGKFYSWTKAELESVLGEDYSWFEKLYKISEPGNWEHGYNHLHLTTPLEFAASHSGLDVKMVTERYQPALQKLAIARGSRVRPGTDDKILASWNGLLLAGLCDAYRALGHEGIREQAILVGNFLKNHMTTSGKLWHSYKNGRPSIIAFLEDYASVSEAYVALYQVTFDEQWLDEAQSLIDYAIANFYDPTDGFFYFTDQNGEALIARKKELLDNVIPSSNSMMAHSLYFTGLLLNRSDYLEIADTMVSKMRKMLLADVQWVTNWASLFCLKSSPTAEIAVIGPEADRFRKDMDRFYIPNKIILGTIEGSSLPLLKDRPLLPGQTNLYVCYDKVCQLPVTSVEKAMQLLQNLY